MITLTKIVSTSIDNINRRIVKFLRFGKSDVQTSFESMPYGIDSNPVKDLIAIYAPTSEKGKTVIIGYINKNQLADVGEIRLFSTDTDGAEKFYVFLKNDGTIEIGGTVDNAVRYQKLDDGLQNFKTQIQTELGKIQTGIIAGGGAYTPATLSLNISNAKIDEVKTL